MSDNLMIDLTMKLSKDNPIFKRVLESERPFFALGHVGTHVDIMEGNIIPLDYLNSRGVVFNVEEKRKEEVSSKDVNLDLVKENDFVFFYTGQIERFEYGSQDYFKDYPQLSNELIDQLIDKKIRFIGIDAAGVRRGKEHAPIDRKCARNGVFIIENLCHLGEIKKKFQMTEGFSVTSTWWDQEGMTGLPCKVIVECSTRS